MRRIAIAKPVGSLFLPSMSQLDDERRFSLQRRIGLAAFDVKAHAARNAST